VPSGADQNGIAGKAMDFGGKPDSPILFVDVSALLESLEDLLHQALSYDLALPGPDIEGDADGREVLLDHAEHAGHDLFPENFFRLGVPHWIGIPEFLGELLANGDEVVAVITALGNGLGIP
jgi:hypothetical protein